MSYLRVNERCSCGAFLKIWNLWAGDMSKQLQEWRDNHKHTPMITDVLGKWSQTRPYDPSRDGTADEQPHV